MNMFWWEGYTDVNLTIDDIIMTFVKNETKMKGSTPYFEITFWLV